MAFWRRTKNTSSKRGLSHGFGTFIVAHFFGSFCLPSGKSLGNAYKLGIAAEGSGGRPVCAK